MRPPPSAWLPKSVQCLRNGYDRGTFLADAIAGLTVGLVALPLGMAFAIASGLPPESGIYCAIVTGFLISALGGSRCQIGGPTGAFVVVVAGIVAAHGVDGLFMCTMMAGILLVILGATGMGSVVRYIPRPVVVGFTNGIAVLIASTQIRDFFGIRMEENPGEFLARMRALWEHAATGTPAATALAGASVITILAIRRFAPRSLRVRSWCWSAAPRRRSRRGSPSKPSAAGSEGSRPDFQACTCRRSEPISSSPYSLPLLPSRCSARSSR
jgi:Sulfate permease and related transporters (MFS superfamily)